MVCRSLPLKETRTRKKKEKHSIDNSDDDDLPESVHYKPRCQRLDPYHGIAIDPNKHFIRQKRKNRLAPTRDLNFTADMWRDHKSVWRHLGSVSIWSTSAFQRLLFPDMFLIFSIGVSLSIATLYGGQFGIFGPDGILFQYLISFEHSTQGIFEGAFGIVVLLLGYRVNTTYSRYVEARILWGALTNSSRDLGRNVCMYVRPPALLSALSSSTASTAESSDALDTLLETQKSRFLNLIRVYPIALRFLLNRKGNHNFISKRDPNFDDQVYVEFRAELYDVWKNHVRISDDYKDNPDLNRILHAFRQKKHVPLLILNMIGSCVSDLSMLRYNDGSSNLPVINPIYIKEMDRQLQRMTTGPFERIVKTPLPTVVTRYASQIMTLLCYTMPFGGIIMLGPYFNPIGSTVGAYLIMSVDDIGIQLEEPFNILPQRQYTDGIVDSIDLIESSFSPAADHSPLRQ